MSRRRLIPTLLIVPLALLAALLTGPSASATTSADTTPPTTPRIGYAQGYYCLSLIVSSDRVTDNVTPQSQLRYEAYADGVFIGTLLDQGQISGVWGVLALKHTGPNVITVRVADAAGNRSAPSGGVTVTGFFTPGTGCVPGRIFG
jgi:hypothetical protein